MGVDYRNSLFCPAASDYRWNLPDAGRKRDECGYNISVVRRRGDVGRNVVLSKERLLSQRYEGYEETESGLERKSGENGLTGSGKKIILNL